MKRLIMLVALELIFLGAIYINTMSIFEPYAKVEQRPLQEVQFLKTLECSPTIAEEENSIYITLYDVPLSAETQTYVASLSEQYNVPENLIYAVMSKESGFNSDVISYSNDFGIMQINAINHQWLSEELGITDFLNERENILAGVYILSILYKQFDETEQVLMAYNCGPTGANNLLAQGITQTEYSQSVLKEMERIRRI